MNSTVVGKTAVWQAKQTLLNQHRYSDPKRLQHFGQKVWSQTDEDGMLNEIFKRIGVESATCVELGVGNGLENNTTNLLMKGWKTLWIDCNRKNVKKIRKHFAGFLDAGQLKIWNAFVTLENVAEIEKLISAKSVDLLSVDIDGNDFHLTNDLLALRPRVCVVEYNGKFDSETELVMSYDPNHIWDSGDCFGASLKAFDSLFVTHGYSLVGCTLSGLNAFFVRNDCLGNHFAAPFTSANHYEPARHWLTQAYTMPSGHPVSYQTISKMSAKPVRHIQKMAEETFVRDPQLRAATSRARSASPSTTE